MLLQRRESAKERFKDEVTHLVFDDVDGGIGRLGALNEELALDADEGGHGNGDQALVVADEPLKRRHRRLLDHAAFVAAFFQLQNGRFDFGIILRRDELMLLLLKLLLLLLLLWFPTGVALLPF